MITETKLTIVHVNNEVIVYTPDEINKMNTKNKFVNKLNKLLNINNIKNI